MQVYAAASTSFPFTGIQPELSGNRREIIRRALAHVPRARVLAFWIARREIISRARADMLHVGSLRLSCA